MRTSALGLVLAIAGFGQDTTDKQEWRIKFKRGETVTVDIQQKISLKLEQIPEEYQEMLGDELFNLDFTGSLAFEVKDLAEEGTATLEGKFKKMRAKGNAMANDIDYEYDAEKPQPDPQPDEGDEPGAPNGMDPTQMLRTLATQTLTLKVDALGKVELQGAATQGGGLANQLFNLNGVMGVLPKEAVGIGDKWKSTDTFAIPGLEQFKIGLRAENTVEKFAKGDVAVVKTKLTAGTIGDETDSPDGSMFNFKMKMTGEGSGTTEFAVGAGRVRTSENKLSVKITATADNPQGGDELEFKATLAIERRHKIGE